TGSSSKRPIYEPSDFIDNISILSKTVSLESITNNQILLKLEEDGLTTPDEKAKELLMRLEFHLRAWSAALEQISFSQIVLCKELRDKIYNSIAKFAKYHRKNIQVIEEGFDSLRSTFNPSNQRRVYNDKNFIKRRNYNIDFLLIHLRDTLHSLRDDETWFKEVLRRTKELLKFALNITPGLLSILAPAVILPFDNSASFVQLRQGLSFKYPIASYYLDWRIMLIIQYNLFNWSETMLNSQNEFDQILNKLVRSLKTTGGFISDMVGNEPLALPNMLWFGMLDLAQNLIQKSSQLVIHGLCYYLAIDSLNKAPSSFIQFKAIEVLLHLQNINEESFSMIELDFNQYAQNLYENNSTDYLEKFQCLLSFVKEKYIIANEMACPISQEPEDQLCILKCQHVISLNNLKRLKHRECPICRERIDYYDLDQIENDHYESEFDDSEADMIIKKKFSKEFKMRTNRFQSIFQIANSKKHPEYKNVIKELDDKNYERAVVKCRDYLKGFPKSYTIRCVIAYAYRCLKKYEQANSYLDETVELKKK
ncbi:9050_t:CDS:2, partial [Funneliformis geosporum]